MINLSSLAALAGRVLIALVFIPAGFGKFGDIAGTMAYTASGGLPGVFGLGAGALELLGGLAILVGWQTRWAALGLAGFALLAGYLYHYIPAQGLEGFDAVLKGTNDYADIAGATQTLDPSAYVLDGDYVPSCLIPAFGVAWPDTYDTANAVRVQYVCGHVAADVPDAKLWMQIDVCTQYAQREGVSAGALVATPRQAWDAYLDPYIIY